MTEVNQNDVLYIRCADGRTKRPDNIQGLCTHQIRLPGGVLDPQYMHKTCSIELPLEAHEEMLRHRIRTMVGLKNPAKIIFASHADCGAGTALGLNHKDVVRIHQTWSKWAQKEFPNVPVEVVHENHSTCGQHRSWEPVDQAA